MLDTMARDRDEHRDYEDLAVRHVMGGLHDAEADAFRSHLMDCAACRARVGELRSIASDLAEVERTERRERAASTVETKQRTEEDPSPAVPTGASRGLRILAVVAVALLSLLSIWNFVLRGQIEGLRVALTAEQTSAEVMNFGDPWSVDIEVAGIDGAVRVQHRTLALMVTGMDDRATYRVSLYDSSGDRTTTTVVTSDEGRLRYLRSELPASVTNIEVTLPRTDSNSTVVFRASAGR